MTSIDFRQIPSDVLLIIVEMIAPDVKSIYRLCCSCKSVYRRVMVVVPPPPVDGTSYDCTNSTNYWYDDSICERVWKNLYETRWIQQQQQNDDETITHNNPEIESSTTGRTSYMYLYRQRLEQDCNAIDTLGQFVQYMTNVVGYKSFLRNDDDNELDSTQWNHLLGVNANDVNWMNDFGNNNNNNNSSPIDTLIVPNISTTRLQRNEVLQILYETATIDSVSSTTSATTTAVANSLHLVLNPLLRKDVQQDPFWRLRLQKFFASCTQQDNNSASTTDCNEQEEQYNDNDDDNIDIDKGQEQYVKYQLAKCIAAHLVIEIHFYQLFKDWLQFWNKNSTDSIADCDGQLLEQGAIILSRFIETSDEHLSLIDNTRFVVTTTLNETANELKRRMDQDRLILSSNQVINDTSTIMTTTRQQVIQVITILNQMFVDELGISGNVYDYYNMKNSSIKAVFFEQKGIPLTMAIIYKLILLRVGIQSNIIGLPGHVVLGIPTVSDEEGDALINDDSTSHLLFVDVYQSGKFLSLDNCKMIVNQYGYEWDMSFVKPLSTGAVIHRMVNNILNSCSRSIARDRASVYTNEIQLRRIQSLEYWSHRRVSKPEWIERIIQQMILDNRLIFNPILCRVYQLDVAP